MRTEQQRFVSFINFFQKQKTTTIIVTNTAGFVIFCLMLNSLQQFVHRKFSFRIVCLNYAVFSSFFSCLHVFSLQSVNFFVGLFRFVLFCFSPSHLHFFKFVCVHIFRFAKCAQNSMRKKVQEYLNDECLY